MITLTLTLVLLPTPIPNYGATMEVLVTIKDSGRPLTLRFNTSEAVIAEHEEMKKAKNAKKKAKALKSMKKRNKEQADGTMEDHVKAVEVRSMSAPVKERPPRKGIGASAGARGLVYP